VANPAKRVLVTGCSTGFGLLTAVEAARAGYEVIATVRDPLRADRLHREAARARPGTIQVAELDVRSPEAIARLVDLAGPVDALVNNAGVCITGSFYDTADDEVDLMMATNFVGPVRLMRAVVPGMIGRGGGRIVNVSSVAGLVGLPGLSGYAASKHALEGFTDGARLELREHGIRVSLVEPGLFATDMLGRNRFEARDAAAAGSPFAARYAASRQAVDRLTGVVAGDPLRVARRIVRILGAARPRRRYLLGLDARTMLVADRAGLLPLAAGLLAGRVR
jgi:NAD(P)-dependent dehydrogenase (short-subunit alcohol dehydrogenase family)